MKKKILYTFSLLLIILGNTSTLSFTSLPIWNESISTNSSSINNILNLESESAILIEQNTGKVLYEKEPHKKLRPASVTKVMSILLIMEALDNGQITLDTEIPCSENASSMGGSQIWLNENEKLTVHEMLKAICIASANDCTYAMAEYLCGSEELFVHKMNEKAKELNMNDTCFKNCHGLDEDGHITSSYDIALMSKELLIKHPEIIEYSSTWMDSLRDGMSELVNTNKLIRTYPGATGLKTGSTSLSLYNLSASATRDNLSLIAVVMRAPTPKLRFNEAKLLLDYGFNNYTYKKIAQKGDLYQTIPIEKSNISNIDLIFENDVGVLVNKNNNSEISQNVTIYKENLSSSIKKDSILGKIEYIFEGNIIAETNLISSTDTSRDTLISTFFNIVKRWFNLVK